MFTTLIRKCWTSLALASLLSTPVSAAISANTTWEVRPTNGVDTNGGGFVAGASGTDFSQQNAAQYSFSNLASSNGTTNPCIVSSTSHNFVATDVGNIMQITAGTNWTTGFYQIVSVSSNNATLDRACGSAASLSSGTFAVGGALKTLSKVNGAMVGGNVTWVKAEATITTASTITMNWAAGVSNTQPALMGYTSSRGDDGQVTIQATASLIPVLQLSSAGATLGNFVIDCNSNANTSGVVIGAPSLGARGYNLLAKNCTSNAGITTNGEGTGCVRCTVTGQTTGAGFTVQNNGQNHYCYWCVAYSNTATGFNVGTVSQFLCFNCIAAGNSGASSDGFNIAVSQGMTALINSDAYMNGRDGVRITLNAQGSFLIAGVISYGNTGKSINDTTSGQFPTGVRFWNYNAYETGSTANVPTGANDVILSADPFTNGAGNDFSLNKTAGGGALLRGTGFPGALAVGGTGFSDIGALQHNGAGGGQVAYPIVQ